MLNCTDLACVLHHHHFYAHLHQLRHHLQEDGESGLPASGNVDSDNILAITNETDAPNDVIYMICGVVIAMLLVGVIIILVAVTINKLRKRDESSATTATTNGGPPPPTTICIETISNGGGGGLVRRASIANGHICGNGHVNHASATSERRVEFNLTESTSEREVTFVRTSGVQSAPPQPNNNLQNNSWVFPPKAPTPHIYNCMNDVMLSANDKNGFKGFRKQFSGRFKRLVSKKNEPAPAIPPELKPQLKTIYVY